MIKISPKTTNGGEDIENDKRTPFLTGFETLEDSVKDHIDQRLSDFRVKSNWWIWAGLLGGITAGVGSLFIGKASTAGFYSRILTGMGNLLTALIYCVVKYTYKVVKNQYVASDSLKFTRKVKALATTAIFIDAFWNVFGGHLTILTFEYSLYAGINQGIISSMFAFNSVFLSIFGWLIFKERANNIQITGMIMLVSSAVLYGVSGGKSSSASDESENHVAAYVPILLALACTFYLMIRSLALKAFWLKYQICALDFMSLSYIVTGVGLLIPLLISISKYGLDMYLFKDWLLGGSLHGASMILMFYSISTGYSGPAAALSSIQSPLQTMLALIFLSQVPNELQLIGLAIGLVGTIIISISPNISRFTNKLKTASNNS